MDLTDSQTRVLRVLAHGRSNTHHVCQQSGFGQQATERLLGEVCAGGLAVQVDRDLYQITASGRDQLDRDYPAEAGFLQETTVVHDAPDIKTLRLRGDRALVEVQVDGDSVALLGDTFEEVLTDAQGTSTALDVET